MLASGVAEHRTIAVRANMWCSVVAGIGLPIGFLVGTQWGLEGVAWSWSIVFPPVNLPAMVIAFRTIRAGFGPWLSALAPAAVSCQQYVKLSSRVT